MSSRTRKPEAVPARLVLVLGGLSAFGPFCIDAYLPALPALGRDLDASASEVQLTLTACLLGLAARPARRRARSATPAAGEGRCSSASSPTRSRSPLCALAPTVWVLDRAAARAGLRRGGRDRHRARRRARPASGVERGAVLRAADARQRARADPRAADRRRNCCRSRRGAASSSCSPGIGAVLVAAAAAGLPETLAPERRHTGGLRATRPAFRRAARRPRLRGLRARLRARRSRRCSPTSPARRSCCRTSTACPPQLFAVVFGAQRARDRRRRARSARRSSGAGRAATAARGAAVRGACRRAPSCCRSRWPRAGLPACCRRCSSSWRASASSSRTRPRSRSPTTAAAGSASALLGMAQFVVGAVAAPLVGVAGTHTAVPMATVIAVLVFAAIVPFSLLTRSPRRSEPVRIAP